MFAKSAFLVSGWVSAFVMVAFFILLLLGYGFFLDGLDKFSAALRYSWLVFALISIGVALSLRRPSKDEAKPGAAAVRILLFATPIAILLAVYVSLFSVDIINDFEAYWKIAGELAQGREADWGFIYDVRAKAMLSPFVSVFGYHPLTFKLANVFYLFICIVSAGWLAYRSAGYRAAKITLLASTLCIGPFAWALMPTHDIPGAVVFMLCTVYILEVCRAGTLGLTGATFAKAAGLVAGAVGIGLLLAWIHFVKTVAPFYLVGGLIALAINAAAFRSASDLPGSPSASILALLKKIGLVIAPLIIASMVQHLVVGQEGLQSYEQETGEAANYWVVAHTNSYGDGSHTRDIKGFVKPYRNFLNPINSERFDTENLHPALANISDEPLGSFEHRIGKAGRLMTFSSNWTYVRNQQLRTGEAEPGPEYNIGPVFAFVSNTFTLLVISASLVIILSGEKLRARGAIIIAPLLVSAGALVMLGQVQARYVMPMWFLGASLIGIAVVSLADFRAMSRSQVGGVLAGRSLDIIVKAVIACIVAAIAFALFVFAARLIYGPADGRPVHLAKHARSQMGGELPSPYAFRGATRPYFGYDGVSVELPDELVGEKLYVWTRAEIPDYEADDCHAVLTIKNDGSSQAEPIQLSNRRATQATFVGAKEVTFDFEKSCESGENRSSFVYEIAFIRAAGQEQP